MVSSKAGCVLLDSSNIWDKHKVISNDELKLTENFLYICKIVSTKLVHFSFNNAEDINDVDEEIADKTDTLESLSLAEFNQDTNRHS